MDYFPIRECLTCLKGPLKRRTKLFFKTDYRLIQVKSIWIFIKLPFVIKIFVLSNFEWSLKTGFTECLRYSGLLSTNGICFG